MKVILPFRDRTNYLRLTLATIKEAMRGLKGIELILVNDASDDKLPAIINELPCTVWTRKERVGPYGSKAVAVRRVFDEFDDKFVMTLDSDCIVHPMAFGVAAKMVADLPKMGLGTVFNTPKHTFNPKDIVKSRYVRKDFVGGLGTVIKKDAWEWYISCASKYGQKHKVWDWDMCLWLKESKKWEIYCTFDSFVDHIGQSGSHSGPECPIDRAFRFLEQDNPKEGKFHDYYQK